MTKKERYIIVFSGYNQRAVIAFLRTAWANHVNRLLIFASSEEDTILKTKYAACVEQVRRIKQLDMGEICSMIGQAKQKHQFEEFVIAPSTEALNRFILLHAETFRRLGCVMTLVDKILYETISDKASFSQVCEKNGITMPQKIPFPTKWGGVSLCCQA